MRLVVETSGWGEERRKAEKIRFVPNGSVLRERATQ
jgi:hypothetical protein